MEESSNGLNGKQKHGKRYGRSLTYLAFGSGWRAPGCIDPVIKNVYIMIYNKKADEK